MHNDEAPPMGSNPMGRESESAEAVSPLDSLDAAVDRWITAAVDSAHPVSGARERKEYEWARAAYRAEFNAAVELFRRLQAVSSAPAPAGDAAADKAFLQGADQAWEQIDACLTALEEDLRKLARAAQFNVNRYELNDAADKVAALIVRRPVSGRPPQTERQGDG